MTNPKSIKIRGYRFRVEWSGRGHVLIESADKRLPHLYVLRDMDDETKEELRRKGSLLKDWRSEMDDLEREALKEMRSMVRQHLTNKKNRR